MSVALELFQPAVRTWFCERYGEPTPPQEQGWPAIGRSEHVLILAPTGSGKTLSAFLWGINSLYARLAAGEVLHGVQLLYISPLKALNNDIERNLREPLAGIRHTAARMGIDLPPISVAVRTGDTPSSARQRQVKHPPQILITTPESLYLLLTSPSAGMMLESVKTVILDEIHTICGNKRGVHLGLSLERLVERAGHSLQRIGLSATQRPLDEVARFLGGQEWHGDKLVPRPVTIIDTGVRKPLDLQVVTPVPDLRHLPGGTIWPSLIPQVLDQIRRHTSTLVYTNNRRGAERTADRLNEQYAQEESEEIEPGSTSALIRDGVTVGGWMFGTGRTGGPFHAHHGSVSKELRLELEQKLKAGQLAALIGTSSLELGIDIGAVDAALQIQSPHSVSRGLQRIGRAGHQVGQTSYGRIYATFREDLLDAAAVAHGMLLGDIEPTYTPRNCLDVLAQQIVAVVAVQDMPVSQLFRLVRRAYGYQDLTYDALTAVLEMLCGKYPSEAFRQLRARLSWDRVADVLHPLPGSRLLAIRNGGTIADRGEFRVYLPDGKTSLGTLDEEFVNETRPGDVITLGTNTWRVTEVSEDKVVVTESGGSMPRLPFWKGEAPKRDYFMGLRLGAFRRQLAERVRELPSLPDNLEEGWPPETEPIIAWLRQDYAMGIPSARNAIHYVRHQLDALGAISSDRTIIAEVFADALGDQRMVIHSCFGSRVNSAWAIALVQALQERWHDRPEVGVNDDGILLRFVEADRDPPLDLLREMKGAEAYERLLLDLPNSALFGTQFRINAQRALLLPRAAGSKRTPFWLQRLRAKDLLTAAKAFPDFPILVETYRDCLRDVLDVEHLQEMLAGIESGQIRIIVAHTVFPSPVASGILYDFNMDGVYLDDMPKAEQQMRALAVNRELLGQLLEEGALPNLLRPEAIGAVEAELQHYAEGYQARDREELAVILHEMGDLTADEISERSAAGGPAWLPQLADAQRVIPIPILPGSDLAERWVASEQFSHYRDAFSLPEPLPALPAALLPPPQPFDSARSWLVQQYMHSHGPFSRQALDARYALPDDWLAQTLAELTKSGQLVSGRLSPGSTETEWCERTVLERIHRRTLSLLRHEITPVSLAAYTDFRTRWQGLHPQNRLEGQGGLVSILQQLRSYFVPAATWERDLLPLRMVRYHPELLEGLVTDGDLIWLLAGEDAVRATLCLQFRGDDLLFGPGQHTTKEEGGLSPASQTILSLLKVRGALYTEELQAAAGLSGRALDSALRELALAGYITSDRTRTLRMLLEGEGEPTSSGGIQSSLADDLATWRTKQPTPIGQRPSPNRLHDAQRRVNERLAPSVRWPGRWSVLPTHNNPPTPEQVQATARMLLQRHGVLARECLAGETLACTWSDLYPALQVLEMRGEIRRGYFIRGLSGAQFAATEAVEELRSTSKEGAPGADDLVLAHACDPVFIPGLAAEGDLGLPSRLTGNYVVLQRGMVLLTYENGSERWRSDHGASGGVLRQAVALVRDHLIKENGLCSQPRRVRVQSWNDASPLGLPVQMILESLGFRRDSPAMVWDGR
ncbi:MAG: DEAD/DEAH box helicase [Anaerolineae bacterium]